MNRLAEALGISPLELRLKNLLQEGSLLSVGTPLPPGVSITQVVERLLRAPAWARSRRRLGGARGVGYACAFKNVGFSFGAPEQCTAIVELHGKEQIERAVLRHAGPR